MNAEEFFHASMLGLDVLSGLGDINGGEPLIPATGCLISYDPDNLTSIESAADLPGEFSDGIDETIRGHDINIVPKFGSITIYNFMDILQAQDSTTSNGVISASADVNVIGLSADLATLTAMSLG